MSDIISVDHIELDLCDPDGTTHWLVTATIADAVQVRPAIYHPADRAEPAEYGPAICCSNFSLDPCQDGPPIAGSVYDQINYLESLDLDWELDEE